jgi:deoxyribose-phosphate aldolase
MSSATESELYIRDFLASNPDLHKELGEVKVDMTDRYTNQEWVEQIAETQRRVLSEVQDRAKKGGKGWKYDAPGAGTKELAKTVDHTLLKLDAKKEGIDSLCSEARIEGFKVSVMVPHVFFPSRSHRICLRRFASIGLYSHVY